MRARKNELSRKFGRSQKGREYQRNYRKRRKVYFLEYQRKYVDKNRDKHNGYNRERYARTGGRGFRRWAIPLSQWQFNRCALCRTPMGDDITVDHIVPQSKGGGSELSNLQAVHKACNSRKKDGYDLFAVTGVSA